ncbi:succinylglutamate desuccinylase/aspartoacylase family protein [Bosea lupini]|nr:succinylglutamate desuccinylase/aspartoacylase family protein [Bosea lupini]
MLTAELGGGAALSRDGLAIAERGLRRVLQRYGMWSGATGDPAPPTRFMRVRSRGAFVYAMRKGLFEPAAQLGAVVRAGQLAGVIHAIDRPWQAPEPVSFTEDGMVACRRAPVLTEPGDCFYKLLVDVDPA